MKMGKLCHKTQAERTHLKIASGVTFQMAHPLKNGENFFFFFGATAPIWVLAYLHETLRFTSVS
jgi:hypothetical protein